MKLNKKVLTSAMKNSISSVLETMFFLPVDLDDFVSEEELWDAGKDKILSARLNFSGPFNGHCVFYIQERLARSVTADFMGKEEKNITEEQAKATLKEMANMVTGNTFALYDPEAVFNLGIPEMVGPNDLTDDSKDSENSIFVAIGSPEDYLAYRMNLKMDD